MRCSASLVFLVAAACGDNSPGTPDASGLVDAGREDSTVEVDAQIDAGPDLTRCSQAPAAGSFVELCSPEQGGTVKHVRIDNLLVTATHASAQVVFGFDDAPASAQAPLAADQFRILFYGGGMPAPAGNVIATFGSVSETIDDAATWVNSASQVCFDLLDGSATTAPGFVMWVTGQKGADCDDQATLTGTSAYAARSLWRGTKGGVDKAAKMFFRQSSGTAPSLELSTTAVLDATEIAALTTCKITPAANTDWQELCAPTVGAAKHVRIENAQASATNSYFYAILGQDANPTGNPAAGAGKLIVTMGQSASTASWSWFRFDDTASSAQHTYESDTDVPLYTQAPTTVCFDIGETTLGNARVLFWATGANAADCADAATLTATSALFDSTTDASAALWDAPLATGKLNFFKRNNANSTAGDVHVFSETAAL